VSYGFIIAFALSAAAQDVPPKIDYNKKSSFDGKQFSSKKFEPKAFSAKEFDAKQYSTKAAPTKEYETKSSKLRDQQFASKDYTPATAEQIERWRKMYEAWRESEAKVYSTTNVANKTDPKLQEQMQKFEKPKSVQTPVVKPTPENINKPVGGSSDKNK